MKMATQALQRRRVSVSPVGAANCKAGSQRRSRSVGEPPAPKQTTAPMRRTSSRYSELQATSLTNAGMRQVAEQCSELTGMLKEKAAKVARSTTGTKNSARNDDAVSVCEVWGKAFKTGSLSTASCSKVVCFRDRIEYTIRGHPQEDAVQMVMEFAHFIEPELHCGSRTFCFRLHRELEYFNRYYNPQNSGHVLSITFASNADVETFERRAWPHIQEQSKMQRSVPNSPSPW